jgi:hypothetical protein
VRWLDERQGGILDRDPHARRGPLDERGDRRDRQDCAIEVVDRCALVVQQCGTSERLAGVLGVLQLDRAAERDVERLPGGGRDPAPP